LSPEDAFIFFIVPTFTIYFIYKSVKYPFSRIHNLAYVFFFSSLFILINSNDYLMKYYWYSANKKIVFSLVLIVFFSWLVISAHFLEIKVKNLNTLPLAESMFSKKELRIEKLKKYINFIGLIVVVLVFVLYLILRDIY
jgi:hypothetical protein